MKVQERKPPVASRQYACNCDLCDADYIGYTTRRLRQ